MAATDLDKLVFYRRTDDRDLIPLKSPTEQLADGSTGSATAAIGFAFRFDGVAYTEIDLFATGFARLAGTEASATNANLFASNTSVLLAPWWDALKTADTNGYLKTELQGEAPRRRFVAEWFVALNTAHTATDTDRVKFQLVLYETWDQVDFRYGAIETIGSPARGSYSASVGVKGDTSTVTDNYRDCTVDNRELGASNTTTTADLEAPDDWPEATLVLEPAWPMCGRQFLLDPDELTGLQDPYAEPIRQLANAANCLMALHCPALVNLSPWQETQYDSVSYVACVTPSADELTYDVYVQTYAAGGDLRIVIDEDFGTHPIPDEDLWWTPLHTEDALSTSAGWTEWAVFQVTPHVYARALRITASHEGAGTVLLGSVLIVPQQLDDIDETASYPSGALPVSIAQLRQQGAAVHPEFYNRCWRTIRAVLADRRQMVWSSVWPDGAKVDLEGTTEKPRRRVAISPAWLWPGQRVTVHAVALSELSGASLTVAEDGGQAVEIPVMSAADGYTYHRSERELQLVSSRPVIVCEADTAGGEIYPVSVTVEWAPSLTDGDLIVGVTPPARLEYLFRLAARIERALRAYAITGLAVALCRGKASSNETRVQYQIPPAVKALRPVVARVTADLGAEAGDTTIFGVTSGAGTDDQVIIARPNGIGRDDYPPEGAYTVITGSQVYDAAPSEAMDRLLESPTALSMAGPVRERLEVLRGVGLTLVAVPADAGEL